ncbi:MAG: hypothetical protein ACJ796_04980 [Gemmatimonadaceae bacterium]
MLAGDVAKDNLGVCRLLRLEDLGERVDALVRRLTTYPELAFVGQRNVPVAYVKKPTYRKRDESSSGTHDELHEKEVKSV